MSTFSGCEASNACQMEDCIAQVKGLPSNSASPTDTWIWLMKPDVQYQGITVPSVFCKLHITPASWEAEIQRLGLGKMQARKNALARLDYEGKVYMQIIKPLLEQRISPHFIRPFVRVEDCSLDNLYALLENKIPGNYRMQLLRNLYTIFYQFHDRLSISDGLAKPPLALKPEHPLPKFSNLRFSYILNEAIDSRFTLTLKETLAHMTHTSPFDYLKFYTILFQIAQACYALFLSQTIHNDLHSGNAWIITTRNFPVNLEYEIDEQTYFFEAVTVKAKLYDFDQAYSKPLGPNLGLSEFSCDLGSGCNELAGTKDFAKLACYILRTLNNSQLIDTVLSFFVPKALVPAWKELYSSLQLRGCFLVWDGKHIPASEFGQLYSYPRVLANIHQYYLDAFIRAHDREIDTSSSPVQRFSSRSAASHGNR